MNKINVGIIFGGISVEHEVSIISGIQTLNAIDTKKYCPIPVYIAKDGLWYVGEQIAEISNFTNITNLIKNASHVQPSGQNGQLVLYDKKNKLFKKNKPLVIIDIVFPVIHGTNGEDGTLQGFLEVFNIPYTGCDVLSSAVGMNKLMFKNMLIANNMPTVKHVELSVDNWILNQKNCVEEVESKLKYPVIIKPANLGSSIGIKSANNQNELKVAANNASKYSASILIENMVSN